MHERDYEEGSGLGMRRKSKVLKQSKDNRVPRILPALVPQTSILSGHPLTREPKLLL
jgi:hypothetical protein